MAKINLSEAETERLAAEISDMAARADQLGMLDTSGIEAATHSVRMQSVFREDVRADLLPREELLANAAGHDGSCFITPRVLE